MQNEVAITFDIAGESRGVVPIELTLYDSKGTRTKTLLSEEREAGKHIERFSLRDMESGVYVLRLRGGDSVVSRKVLVVQ